MHITTFWQQSLILKKFDHLGRCRCWSAEHFYFRIALFRSGNAPIIPEALDILQIHGVWYSPQTWKYWDVSVSAVSVLNLDSSGEVVRMFNPNTVSEFSSFLKYIKDQTGFWNTSVFQVKNLIFSMAKTMRKHFFIHDLKIEFLNFFFFKNSISSQISQILKFRKKKENSKFSNCHNFHFNKPKKYPNTWFH